MSGVTWIFAAGGIGEPLVILILILISIISYVVQWLGKLNQPGPGKAPPRPAAAGPPQQQDKNVEDEVAEFLRRAAERRGQPASAPGAPASGTPRPAAKSPAAPPSGRRPPQRPVPAQVVPEQPVGAEVPQHVEKYLNTGEFTQRSARLGAEVAQTDAQLGEHLHEVFDHQVSALAGKPGEAAATPVVEDSPLPEDRLQNVPQVTAAALIAQLSDLEGLRQAIVINEILRRPEERWR